MSATLGLVVASGAHSQVCAAQSRLAHSDDRSQVAPRIFPPGGVGIADPGGSVLDFGAEITGALRAREAAAMGRVATSRALGTAFPTELLSAPVAA